MNTLHDLYRRIRDWLWLKWLDFDYWRETTRRRRVNSDDWRRLK